MDLSQDILNVYHCKGSAGVELFIFTSPLPFLLFFFHFVRMTSLEN